MAPRSSNFSAMSMSTTNDSCSLFTEDNSASIDVISLDDPAKMSPNAIQAELQYYGVEQVPRQSDRDGLEKALVFARRRSNNDHNGDAAKRSPSNQHQQQYEPQQPGTTPQHHLHATAAKVPGMRVTPPNSSHPPNNLLSSNNNALSSGGKGMTHIPLTPTNRIPSQILNIIRISADPSMKAINLDNRNLGDAEVIKLSEAMERNHTVTFLSLNNNGISDGGVAKLAKMLLRNETLQELHLGHNVVTTEGAAALGTALITNETLAVLTLNDNVNMGDKGVVYLMSALEHNTKLRTLDVENCGLVLPNSTSGGSRGSKSSSRVNRLQQIENLLEDRQIDSNFESLLERLLDDDYRVTGIDLSGRRIGVKGATRLAEALVDNTQVRQLWLRGCNIGDVGARALASCLEQNMTIVDLFLGNNGIGNEGLVAISDALAISNATLVSLELDDNNVGQGGLHSFLRALDKNTSVLVASFENNPGIRNNQQGKVQVLELEAKLAERRNGLNLVTFVVDPDAGGESTNDGVNSGLVNMSVCSSYMPSTYLRAGFTSQGGGGPHLHDSGNMGNKSNMKSPGSHNFSVYNRTNSRDPQGPTPRAAPVRPQPPRPPFTTQQQQQPRSPQKQQQLVPVPKKTSPRDPSVKSSKSSPRPSKPKNFNRTAPKLPHPPMELAVHERPETIQQQQQHIKPKPKANLPKKRVPRAQSPPPARSIMYERSHVPVPLKAQALEVIIEQSVEGSSRVSSAQKSSSGRYSQKQVSSRNLVPNNYGLSPIISDGEDEAENWAPLVRKRSKISVFTEEPQTLASKSRASTMGLSTLESLRSINHLAANLQNPDTQQNFNTTLMKLYRRVEMMRRTHHFAAAHYRACQFWCWFVPISSSICVSVLLSLASVLDVLENMQVALALFAAFFSCSAFGLNFLQGRHGWSSLASVHRSTEVELASVAFRLDTLVKYDGQGLTTGSHSTRSRANAIRDLYRIDVYLQAMQRCTPTIPNRINELFYLFASKLKEICVKYPNAVMVRSDYYEEEYDPDNPVPLDMQIDALDLLGSEIEDYFLYPLFFPDAKDVSARTIDMFFAAPTEGRGGERQGEESMDSRSYYSEDEIT